MWEGTPCSSFIAFFGERVPLNPLPPAPPPLLCASMGAMLGIVALFAINRQKRLWHDTTNHSLLPLIYKICANKNYTIRQTEKIIIKCFFLFSIFPLSLLLQEKNITQHLHTTDNKQHLINVLSVVYGFSLKAINETTRTCKTAFRDNVYRHTGRPYTMLCWLNRYLLTKETFKVRLVILSCKQNLEDMK